MMLYDLLFKPVVVILKALYLALFSIAGDWGTSLILLAVVMNVLLRPLMAWSSRLQDRERILQNILTPQIAEIGRELHGAERHAELTELYRRYAYHPAYAIRSNAGLFIQLPFLIAAYTMLSSLEFLQGQPYFFIRDLSLPDSLLYGINLLPLLMTTINFLAAWTTEGFSNREKVQASVVGLLFLVLLYNAPSALLVYWICNNVILLLKNLVAPARRFLGLGTDFSEISERRFLPAGRNALLLNVGGALLTLVILGCYVFFFRRGFIGLHYEDLARTSTFQNACVCAFLFVLALVWMLFWRFLSRGGTLAELAAKTGYVLIGALVAFIYVRFVLFPLEFSEGAYFKIFFILLAAWLLFAFLLPVPAEKLSAWSVRLNGGVPASLYFASVTLFVVFVCIFYPSLLFLTDPSFFPDTLPITLLKLGPYGVGFLLVSLMLWLLLPALLRRLAASFAALLVCMVLVNAFLLTEKYGDLDALMFGQPWFLLYPGLRVFLKDSGSFLIAFAVLSFCVWKGQTKRFVGTLWLISFALIGASGYCYFSSAHVLGGRPEAAGNLPPYHERLWRFSRTDKNVVAFFFDGFTGDHLPKIVAENPTLAERLDGFVSYPDTLATGCMTFLSTPSIYAGPSYKANVLNRTDPDSPLREKFARSLTVLPNVFTRNGYDVVMAGTPYLESGDAFFHGGLESPDSVLLLYGDNWAREYIPHWLKWAETAGVELGNEDVDISRFLLNLSLFRAIPFTLRINLYNGGNWRGGVAEQVLEARLRTHFMSNLPPMQFMSDFALADESGPTFKMIRSMLSHYTWHLPMGGVHPVLDPYPETPGQFIPVGGIIPEHYYTETHMMRFVADFVTSLKRLGVYDNTRIVIFSDHDSGDSWGLNEKVGRDVYQGDPNALLMFKDFASKGPLRFSEALMSCEDVPTFLLEGVEQVDGIPGMEELKRISGPDRVRVHCVGTRTPDRKLFDATVYKVKGTIFQKENWSREGP